MKTLRTVRFSNHGEIYPSEFHETPSRLEKPTEVTCAMCVHGAMTCNKVADRVAIFARAIYALLYARAFRGERRVVASVTKEILRNESDLCRAFYVRALDLSGPRARYITVVDYDV